MIFLRRTCLQLVTLASLFFVVSCQPETPPPIEPDPEPVASPKTDDRAATVSEATGAVTVADRGPTKAGDAVNDGERISTGVDGLATLSFVDGTELRMVPRTSIVVARHPTKRSKISVALLVGVIWNNVTTAVTGGEKYEVQTGSAVCGVRGTQFRVASGLDGQTTVRVTHGAVEVAPRRKMAKQAPLRVEPGKQVRVPAEVVSAEPVAVEPIPAAPLPASAEEVETWYADQLASAKDKLPSLTEQSVTEGVAAQEKLAESLSRIQELEKKRSAALAAPGELATIDTQIEELANDALRARALMSSYLTLVEEITHRAEADPAVVGGAKQVQVIQAANTRAAAHKKKRDTLRRSMRRLDRGGLARKAQPPSGAVTPVDPAPAGQMAPGGATAPAKATPQRAVPKMQPRSAVRSAPDHRKRVPIIDREAAPAEPAPALKKTDAPEEAFAASAEEALAPAPARKKIKLTGPDKKRNWQTPAEVETAMNALTAQMDKIAGISAKFISTEQKIEELELRLAILKVMDQAVGKMMPDIQSRMTKTNDSKEGMKLFKMLQAAKILQPKIKQRVKNYSAQIRDLKRVK